MKMIMAILLVLVGGVAAWPEILNYQVNKLIKSWSKENAQEFDLVAQTKKNGHYTSRIEHKKSGFTIELTSKFNRFEIPYFSSKLYHNISKTNYVEFDHKVTEVTKKGFKMEHSVALSPQFFGDAKMHQTTITNSHSCNMLKLLKRRPNACRSYAMDMKVGKLIIPYQDKNGETNKVSFQGLFFESLVSQLQAKFPVVASKMGVRKIVVPTSEGKRSLEKAQYTFKISGINFEKIGKDLKKNIDKQDKASKKGALKTQVMGAGMQMVQKKRQYVAEEITLDISGQATINGQKGKLVFSSILNTVKPKARSSANFRFEAPRQFLIDTITEKLTDKIAALSTKSLWDQHFPRGSLRPTMAIKYKKKLEEKVKELVAKKLANNTRWLDILLEEEILVAKKEQIVLKADYSVGGFTINGKGPKLTPKMLAYIEELNIKGEVQAEINLIKQEINQAGKTSMNSMDMFPGGFKLKEVCNGTNCGQKGPGSSPRLPASRRR